MKLKALALAAMMGLGAGSLAAHADELPGGPHIVTSGQASVDARPDIATLAIEVNVSSKDAAEAKKQADDRVAQYFDFLSKNGIEKKDIDAANLRTQPEYDYSMYKAADAAPMASAAQTYEQQSIHFDDQVDVVFELQRNP
ncbi:MAG: SIMPL domain-containing protein [Pantoea sp.]|nr:SIMPL domain-containing protein [Pantoea sp.]